MTEPARDNVVAIARYRAEDRGFVSWCWIWTRQTDGKGYGYFRRGGRHVLAHRYVYEQHRGPIPEGLELDHLCRVPACVNPAHLEPVTHTENVRRGKAVKLTVAEAIEIRDLCQVAMDAAPPLTARGTPRFQLPHGVARDLAERYGVTNSQISSIWRERRWKDVAA